MSFKIKPEHSKPEGFIVFEYATVAGVPFRKPNALVFAKGKHHTIEWERELNNKEDPNAIKMFGCTKGLLGKKRQFIGYVPREIFQRIVDSSLWGLAQPYFQSICVGDVDVAPGDEFIEVSFQVLGPKTRKKEYKST